MNKLLATFLLVAFILWILPLGFFIKPSQEKLACDGQRAMCMCHVLIHKEATKAMEHGLAVQASSTNKENSSGSGNYFVSARPLIVLNLRLTSFFENPFLAYKNPFLASIEQVPKV